MIVESELTFETLFQYHSWTIVSKGYEIKYFISILKSNTLHFLTKNTKS